MKKRHKIFRYLLLLGLGALLVRFYLPSKPANFLFNHEQNAYGLTSAKLHSPNVILEKLDTQEIIYEKNKDEKGFLLNLIWYGGEPLLVGKKIIEFMNKISEFAPQEATLC